jgi:peptidoglycan hydrolase-like protein with peptidoglycan-binding domain
MGSVLRSRRHRATSRAVPVALALVVGLVATGCAPTDGAEPEPAAAPSVATTAPTPSPTPSPSGDGDDGREQDAREKAEQDAREKAEQEAQDRAEQEAREKAEQEAQDKAEQEAREKAAQEAKDKADREAREKAAQEAQDKAEQEAREKAEQEKRDAMLRSGSSGERVVALQERLVELGYFLPEVDGSFGPATQQAVWALQKAAGLSRDGVIGPKTQAALDAGKRPNARTSSGRAVEIDLDRQLLMTVEDGRVTRIVNASSGNGESYQAKGRTYRASTPRGSFAVYMDRNYLHESTLELGSMWRPKYFSGGFAVHGSGSIPPYPASHGCVRVSNTAMNWLWDSWGMPKGTPVVLY